MNLEEFTKEELIWAIRHRCFKDADDFEFDILMQRYETKKKKASAYFKHSNKALRKYCDLMGPYDGKTLNSVPASVIHEADQNIKIYETDLKQYELLEKQSKKIEDQINKILKRGSSECTKSSLS